MATERAALDAQAQQIQAESFRLTLDQNASSKIMRRRHQSHLPPVYEPRNLFNTPGAGTSGSPVVNWAVETTGAGTPVQPRATDPPCLNNTLPQHVATPSGHYSNPLDSMIAAETRLAALPVEGESPTAIETQSTRELLQTAVSAFWERGSLDLPACGPRCGSASRPVRPIFTNKYSRRS